MRALKQRQHSKSVQDFNYFSMIDTHFEYNYEKKMRPTTVQPHFHNSYEILLFMQGSAVYNVEGQVYELKKNDLLITNPRELHRPHFINDEVYERSIIFVKPAFLSEFITDGYNPFWGLEQRKPGTQNLVPGEYVTVNGIDKMMEQIGYYVGNKLPQSSAMIKSYVMLLLNAVNASITVEKGLKNNKVLDIIVYINQNIFDKITLDMLEEKFFMSKYHISHIFKVQTGFTICEYITRKRILYAKELMISGLSAGEAAEKSGFTDYSMFYKAFKKITAAAPSDYVTVKSRAN